MSAEWLAKLTTKSLRVTGEGFGGFPSVTWDDIAAGLAGTNRLGYLLLLSKYTDDRNANSLFIAELAKEIEVEKNCAINIALRVAVACSFPVINPMRCPTCHGRGTIFPRKKGKSILDTVRKCHVCDGNGYRQLSERKRADIAGIASSTWHDSWKKYCNKKEKFLWEIEASSINHLRRNIKDVA